MGSLFGFSRSLVQMHEQVFKQTNGCRGLTQTGISCVWITTLRLQEGVVEDPPNLIVAFLFDPSITIFPVQPNVTASKPYQLISQRTSQ